MAANPNDPRTQRRKMLGDDPNKISMSPQPIPGAPQDQQRWQCHELSCSGYGWANGSAHGQGRWPVSLW